MRPPVDQLVGDYIADLQSEIDSNAREIAGGRTDLFAYDVKVRAELAALLSARTAGTTLGVDAYGIPSIEAGRRAEIEALQLLAAVVGRS